VRHTPDTTPSSRGSTVALQSAPSTPRSAPTPPADAGDPAQHLLRIQEVAAEVGLTTRSIRYYEELGLLSPAARSEGAYRLYDASDLERLRYIKGLRDDAGFSLSEINLLLEDEAARQRGKAALKATEDPSERRTILRDSVARLDRQIESLQSKVDRIQGMVDEADARRTRLLEKLAGLDSAGGSGTADGAVRECP
jgi:DNA-binding transcriptional MerR regulator